MSKLLFPISYNFKHLFHVFLKTNKPVPKSNQLNLMILTWRKNRYTKSIFKILPFPCFQEHVTLQRCVQHTKTKWINIGHENLRVTWKAEKRNGIWSEVRLQNACHKLPVPPWGKTPNLEQSVLEWTEGGVTVAWSYKQSSCSEELQVFLILKTEEFSPVSFMVWT